MLLEGKNAIIYGGAGVVGGAVARAFANEGAAVFLAGRTDSTLDAVAEEIRAAGGTAETAVVDALDETAVNDYVDRVVAEAGGLHVSFNAISHGDVQGSDLVDMTVTDFMAPIDNGVRTQFITTRAAARHMIGAGRGVILAFGGTGGTMPKLGGLTVGLDAIEGLRRQWATELGPHGVRVVTLQTGGITESIPPGFSGREEIVASIDNATLLGRGATLAEVGDVACFIASDKARAITGAAINITCGSILDYR